MAISATSAFGWLTYYVDSGTSFYGGSKAKSIRLRELGRAMKHAGGTFLVSFLSMSQNFPGTFLRGFYVKSKSDAFFLLTLFGRALQGQVF